MFDKLDEKIEDTSFSIHDFFQFDESGKLTSNGIFNFFDALEEKQEKLGLGENEKWISYKWNCEVNPTYWREMPRYERNNSSL